MRRLLLSILMLLLWVCPAWASDTTEIPLFVLSISIFQVNNPAPLAFSFDSYDDFGVGQDIGDIDYDLQSNSGWQVDAIILDGVQNGQTANDWDDTSWTLAVNGVEIDELSTTTIDSDPAPVDRTNALWHVALTIPWPESASTPDCTIEMTASSS
jgi:hypothetical protein